MPLLARPAVVFECQPNFALLGKPAVAPDINPRPIETLHELTAAMRGDYDSADPLSDNWPGIPGAISSVG